MNIRRFPDKTPIYLSCIPTDMRKSINGLAAIVSASFQIDPFEGAVFVFCSKDKSKIKILHWDKDGFALYYKRRERGRFCWPSLSDAEAKVDATLTDLNRLLDGLLMEKFIPHKSYTIL
ncbi:MAG: transposase [Clostridia bacterium]|nr:transposase [Clostridia bacterium]